MPGVRSVGRVELHTVDNIDSVPWIGAPAVWSKVGRGEGVSIGIIDTGIDYTHADFGGSGSVAEYDANNKNIIEPGTFPTAKVKGGYGLRGRRPTTRDDPASVPQPDADPLDGNGHGSHVAGTAAGIGVQGSVGPGVAPGADLYALKVFGDDGGSTDVTSQAIEWAMDPNDDGDMSDHLDVINMSLGSPFGEPDRSVGDLDARMPPRSASSSRPRPATKATSRTSRARRRRQLWRSRPPRPRRAADCRRASP